MATVEDRVENAVFQLAYRAFAAMPLASTMRVGEAVGSLFYVFDRRRRRVALRNLALAFPGKSERERLDILLESCRNIGRIGAEICHLESLTAESVRRFVRVDDQAVWERTMRAGEEHGGAIILTAHLGNWELLAYAHGLWGHPVTLVHRPMRNPLVDAAILRIRCRPGTRSLPKKSSAKDVLRALREKQMLVMAADQNQRGSAGVFVDVFGVPACTTPGPARLAMAAKVPVIPAFLVREGRTARHRVVILPDVEIDRSGDRDADIVRNTQRCSDVIEGMIRRYPEQWIWFHKRWRTRPEGEPGIY